MFFVCKQQLNITQPIAGLQNLISYIIQGTRVLCNHAIHITGMHADKKKSEQKYEDEKKEMWEHIAQQNEGMGDETGSLNYFLLVKHDYSYLPVAIVSPLPSQIPCNLKASYCWDRRSQ